MIPRRCSAACNVFRCSRHTWKETSENIEKLESGIPLLVYQQSELALVISVMI